MNVALFASAFHPHVGGVEELVRQLAHEYRRRGMQTIVLTNRWPRSLPAYELYEKIPVYRLAMRMPEWNWKVRLVHAVSYPFTRQRMLRILKRHRIDLLHVQCVSSNGYYALAARRAMKLPLVVTAQGERTMDACQIYERSPILNRTLRGLLDEADYVTACSQNTLADLEQWWGESFASRASVVYNGIALDDFDGRKDGSSHSRPYILGLGRLVEQKGFDLLLRAFALSRVQGIDLLIAGDGPEGGKLRALAGELGISNRVRFIGSAAREEVVTLFRNCEFFVLPSRQEPMGIVNLEAMAAGKAVIASRIGGVPELVIDDENGLLFPVGDTSALAEAIARLAGDVGFRQRLAASGIERVRGFAWPSIADQYEQIYDRVKPASELRKPMMVTAPVSPVS